MNPWPVFVISMRPEFWARLEAQATALGLPATRFDATDGKSIDLEQWKRDGLFEPPADPSARLMTRGEIGCAHSHAQVWSHVAGARLEGALILEDDADLPPDLPEWLARAQRHAGEWDILYLGFSPWAHTVPVAHAPGFVIPDLAPAWNVMHAYLVTAAGAQALLDGAQPIRLPVDVYVSRRTQSGVRAWQAEKPVVGLCQGTYSSTQGIV
jgi:GR25 family glycosyltransferase involved in LPS biosynthesis